MTKRPSFQFYPSDWMGNTNLRRCTLEEKGVWMELLCLFHDSDEYGILRWTLKQIQNAIGCKMKSLLNLIKYGVLKGSEKEGEKVSFSTTFSQRNESPQEVILIENEAIPYYFSSRMVRDEYVRKKRGEHGIKSLSNPAVPRSKKKDKVSLSPSIEVSFSPSPTSSSTSTTTNIKNNIKSPTPLNLEIPVWLASSDWDNFVQHRKEMKKPLTPRAAKMALTTLTELRNAGNDIEQVIRQSIVNGWKGLFLVKQNNHGKEQSYVDKLKRAGEIINRECAGTIFEIQSDMGGEMDKKRH